MADVAEERRVLYVEVRGEENDGLQLEVGPDGLLVGRANTCDIIFQNREVSRRHAYFYSDGHRCHVEDLGSKNGLLVNGRRVSKTSLRDGDVVDIGPSQFRIRSDESDSSVAVAGWPAPASAATGAAAEPQQMRLRNPLAVASFVFAVLATVHWGFGLGAVVLALLSLWETRGEGGSPGRGLAWAGLALGLAGGLLNGWFTEAAPRLHATQAAVLRRDCGGNLRQIGVALGRYRATHDGRYPARLTVLVGEGLLSERDLLCPGCLAQGRQRCEYAYAPPAAGDEPRRVVACDNSPDNHTGGGWVLRADGVAQWMGGTSFARIASQLQERATAARGGSAP